MHKIMGRSRSLKTTFWDRFDIINILFIYFYSRETINHDIKKSMFKDFLRSLDQLFRPSWNIYPVLS